MYIHYYFKHQYYYAAIYRLTVYFKPQPTMEYSKSVVAKQGTTKSVLVLPKDIHSTSIHEDTLRYSTPIQAEEDVRNSMMVASVVHLNNTR